MKKRITAEPKKDAYWTAPISEEAFEMQNAALRAKNKATKSLQDEIAAMEEKLGSTVDGVHFYRKSDSRIEESAISDDFGYITEGGSIIKLRMT